MYGISKVTSGFASWSDSNNAYILQTVSGPLIPGILKSHSMSLKGDKTLSAGAAASSAWSLYSSS